MYNVSYMPVSIWRHVSTVLYHPRNKFLRKRFASFHIDASFAPDKTSKTPSFKGIASWVLVT